jgi:hypothetical protein
MFVCDTRFFLALVWLIGYSESWDSDNRLSTILITNHYMFLQFIAHLQVVHVYF